MKHKKIRTRAEAKQHAANCLNAVASLFEELGAEVVEDGEYGTVCVYINGYNDSVEVDLDFKLDDGIGVSRAAAYRNAAALLEFEAGGGGVLKQCLQCHSEDIEVTTSAENEIGTLNIILCRNCGSLVKAQFDANGVPVDMVRLGYCKKGGC